MVGICVYFCAVEMERLPTPRDGCDATWHVRVAPLAPDGAPFEECVRRIFQGARTVMSRVSWVLFPRPLLTACLSDQWRSPQASTHKFVGSTPGSATFPFLVCDTNSFYSQCRVLGVCRGRGLWSSRSVRVARAPARLPVPCTDGSYIASTHARGTDPRVAVEAVLGGSLGISRRLEARRRRPYPPPLSLRSSG